MFKKYILLCFIGINIISCENPLRKKELALKEKELSLEENSSTQFLATKDAIKLAEKQFENYLPKILESHEAILDVQESFTGDFTGDGVEDIAIYFCLAPNNGGNAIIGQGLSLYQKVGNEVKVIAGYEPKYLFSFNKISNGKIYVEKLEYAEGDGRCCPSIKTNLKLKVIGNKVYEETS
ncbi:MAG: hypothetical protein JNL75_04665 [Chitinophagales bacterium]|nr:hypothetical protein [Chitinophagales bacterium]